MKMSVSLPDDDVEFLDSYAKERGIPSRSAVVHRAVRLLRATELGRAYEEAWQEWNELGENVVWDVSASDGVTP